MKSMKCVCGKKAKYVKNLKFNTYVIDGWKCSCGEIYYNPERAEKILLLNKIKKSNYKITLGKVKSNLILRLPKEVGEVLELKKGEVISLELQDNNKILITTSKTPQILLH